MNEEKIDVVDAKDRPTGQSTTKEEAHRKGFRHRIAAVLVFQSNQLLLQVHENSDGLLDHTVGGHVSAGETYEAAAVREMKEEINLNEPVKMVALSVFADEVWKGLRVIHFSGVYKAIAPPEWRFEPNKEVKKLLPMTPDELIHQMTLNPLQFTGGLIASFNAYLKSEGLANEKIIQAAKVKGVIL